MYLNKSKLKQKAAWELMQIIYFNFRTYMAFRFFHNPQSMFINIEFNLNLHIQMKRRTEPLSNKAICTKKSIIPTKQNCDTVSCFRSTFRCNQRGEPSHSNRFVYFPKSILKLNLQIEFLCNTYRKPQQHCSLWRFHLICWNKTKSLRILNSEYKTIYLYNYPCLSIYAWISRT